MAKVTIEFDTVDKSMAIAIDGKAVDNVQYVSLSTYDGDEFGCSIETVAKDDEHDMRTYTRLCASESKDGKELRDSIVSDTFPGFVKAEIPVMTKAQTDIQSFFAK